MKEIVKKYDGLFTKFTPSHITSRAIRSPARAGMTYEDAERRRLARIVGCAWVTIEMGPDKPRGEASPPPASLRVRRLSR
jgi:hypothetical protein